MRASLVSEFGRDAVLRVLPRVAERVKQQAKEDVYFGFAVPYFRKELAVATSRASCPRGRRGNSARKLTSIKFASMTQFSTVNGATRGS